MSQATSTITTYASERERKYYEEILPKLSAGIKQMNLDMRSNFVLVNAGIYTVKDLRKILEAGEHIQMLDKEEEEYICRCLQIQLPKKDKNE